MNSNQLPYARILLFPILPSHCLFLYYSTGLQGHAMRRSSEPPCPQTRLNQEQLKLYISLCEEPVPDIVNGDEDIHSQFKFYFNDDLLTIRTRDDARSALNSEGFSERVNRMFAEWERMGEHQNSSSRSPRLKESTSEGNQHEGPSRVHRNFIAFVQHWVRNSPELLVRYAAYDQLVSSCVSQFLGNSICKLAFAQASPKRPFNLKTQFKSAKVRKQQPFKLSLSDSTIQKRLHAYFTHFSKLQNLSPNSSNPLYRNNGSKTFDEIVKIHSTVNLPQWISFVKAFGFDKMFQASFKKVGSACVGKTGAENGTEGKMQRKNYLPVRNVKWSSSLQYFKNLFEKFCDNAKNLDFQAFRDIIKKLLQQFFSLKSNQAQQSPATKPPLNSPQELGIAHLKLTTESQFNDKLRSLGLFVPQNPTKILSPAKSYTTVKPRYLQQPTLPALSPIKIRQGKNNHSKLGISIPLPGIQKKPEKLYTLQNLMKSKKPQKQTNLSRFNQSNRNQTQNSLNQNQPPKLTKKQTKNHPPPSYSKHPKINSTYHPPRPQQNNLKNSQLLKQIRQQIQEQPDQYLAHYYGKDWKNNNGHHYQNDSPKQSRLGNSSNIMKRLDDRIRKMNKKVL